ncbi:Gp19/Gp15/Gp42 family protein [Nocardia sp. NPDC050193]
MAYAEPTDVISRWGKNPAEVTPEDTALITTRLADIEREIRRRIPYLDDKITAGDIDVEDVRYVEANAVLRVVRNPEGYTQESDGNYSYMFSRDSASGVLYITPAEWRLLGVNPRGMFVIAPVVTRRVTRVPFECGG